ncbi:MAG: 4-demethylwyosine synthase TYW1 [Candidatus Woesearchaeota archaeon]
MLNEQAIQELESQQYRMVGTHSAVKVCGWTKNLLKGLGGCYKLAFYGIKSHQCLQMTSSLSCANRCIFCWRGYKAPVSTEWKWAVDEPEEIIEGSIKAQGKLLEGFGGNPTADKKAYDESKQVRHVALSLTGEPIMYPRINELLRGFDKRNISTFLVTNGQYPEAIENMGPVTQLYLSMDAVDEEMAKDISKPLFQDHWQRFKRSMKAVRETPGRTAVRITVIRYLNDNHHEGFSELLKETRPDFIEVKGYMHVGESQHRLDRNNMPFHTEIQEFSNTLNGLLEDYDIVTEHEPSRVVLLARKDFKKDDGWHTWIDFRKWFELINKGKNPASQEYNAPLQTEFEGIYQNTGTKISIIKEQQKRKNPDRV